MITNPTEVIEEKEHIDQALAKCGYPEWAFDRISKDQKPNTDWQWQWGGLIHGQYVNVNMSAQVQITIISYKRIPND